MRRRRLHARGALRLLLAAAVAAALTSGCGPPETPDEAVERQREQAAERVVARIDGEPVTLGEFEASLREQPVFVRRSLKGATAYRRHFAELLNFRLLAQAAQARGLARDPDVQLAVREALAEAFWSTPALWSNPTELTEAEIRAAYESQPERYRAPERLELVALELPDAAAARRVVLEHAALRGALHGAGRAASVPAAETFEAVLRAHAPDGVEVRPGPQSLDEVGDTARRSLFEAALAGEAVSHAPVSHVADGRTFVYMSLSRERGALPPLETVRNRVVQDLLVERRRAEREALLRQWRREATVRIVDERARALLSNSP